MEILDGINRMCKLEQDVALLKHQISMIQNSSNNTLIYPCNCYEYRGNESKTMSFFCPQHGVQSGT